MNILLVEDETTVSIFFVLLLTALSTRHDKIKRTPFIQTMLGMGSILKEE